MLVDLFNIDALAIVMIILVSFVGLNLYSFSKRYMQGDIYYSKFLLKLVILCSAVIIMVTANHLVLFLAAWSLSNILLVNLMIHKPNWQAAKAAGVIAGKNFILGFAFIAIGFTLLYITTETAVITDITTYYKNQNSKNSLILILIFLGAMTQSAIWPFHIWLISSLNSPTPVSAIMHAGLINGGGFLMARFAPLYLNSSEFLNIIFIFGLITALLGNLWKLIQSDVKRMLACSTMGQMGFMFMQCGLGLFSVAITHLCWHGLFKAYLFLASGSAAQEKKVKSSNSYSSISLLLSLCCGIVGSYIFSVFNHIDWSINNTSFLPVFLAFIIGTQFALTIINNSLKKLPLAIITICFIEAIYGVNVYLIDYMLATLNINQPQKLNIIHVIGLLALLIAWLFSIFGNRIQNISKYKLWLYVKALNASQPHYSTITPSRNHYKYL